METARSQLLDLASAKRKPIRDPLVLGDEVLVRQLQRREPLRGRVLQTCGRLSRRQELIALRAQHPDFVVELTRALLCQLERGDELGLARGRRREPRRGRLLPPLAISGGTPAAASHPIKQAAHPRRRPAPRVRMRAGP